MVSFQVDNFDEWRHPINPVQKDEGRRGHTIGQNMNIDIYS